MASVEIYQDESERQEWRWRVKASNGKVLGASSEGFARRSYTENNLKSLPSFCLASDIKVASEDETAKRPLSFYKDEADEWRWRIKAGNGQITHASSEGFVSKQNAVDNVAGLASRVREWKS